jgi:hypothetical protein
MQGLIGTTSTLPSFSSKFHLKDPSLSETEQASRLGNITSMLQLGSIGGALIAFYITDKIGRIWATRQLCLLWVIGIAIFLSAGTTGSIGQIYAGRFSKRIGITLQADLTSFHSCWTRSRAELCRCSDVFSGNFTKIYTRTLCMYVQWQCVLGDHVRFGILITLEPALILLTMCKGYFAVWGSSLHISGESQLQWIMPNMLHIYFASIIAVSSLFAVESPRWLMKVGKYEKRNKQELLRKPRMRRCLGHLSELINGVRPHELSLSSEHTRAQDDGLLGTSRIPLRDLSTMKVFQCEPCCAGEALYSAECVWGRCGIAVREQRGRSSISLTGVRDLVGLTLFVTNEQRKTRGCMTAKSHSVAVVAAKQSKMYRYESFVPVRRMYAAFPWHMQYHSAAHAGDVG